MQETTSARPTQSSERQHTNWYYFVISTGVPAESATNQLLTRTVGAARRTRQTGNRVGGAEIRRRSRTCGLPPTSRRRCCFPRRRHGSRRQLVCGRKSHNDLPCVRGPLIAAAQ